MPAPKNSKSRNKDKDKDKYKRRKKIFHRRKVCRFCADTSLIIDYKDPKVLAGFVTERGKIIPSRISGTCNKHQRALSLAVKRARTIALMPYVGRVD
jgi:small subunit ribosomal protein S18